METSWSEVVNILNWAFKQVAQDQIFFTLQ